MTPLLALAFAAFQQAPQDPVQARLESSPRHHEWVELESGGRKLRCFAVFPEVKDKVQAVIVIHENKGLTDWVRSVADRLAEAGYVAIAPDLLSGKGPEGGSSSSFPSTDAATQAIYALDAKQVLDPQRATQRQAARVAPVLVRLEVTRPTSPAYHHLAHWQLSGSGCCPLPGPSQPYSGHTVRAALVVQQREGPKLGQGQEARALDVCLVPVSLTRNAGQERQTREVVARQEPFRSQVPIEVEVVGLRLSAVPEGNEEVRGN